MTTRYYYSTSTTTNTLSNVTYVNFNEPQYLNLYWECTDSGYPTSFITFHYNTSYSTILNGSKSSDNSNYFITEGSYATGSSNYPYLIFGPKTITVPAGSYIFLPTHQEYVEYEYSDGTVSSGYEYYHYGSEDKWIIPSAGRAYSTVKNELSNILLGHCFDSIDENDNIEYSDVYASIDNLVYYCKTNVVFYGWEEQDSDTGDCTGYLEYRSGTLQYLTGTVTSSTNTSYTVKTNNSYDYTYGGYAKGSYSLEPSSVSLTSSTPKAGQNATISVYRTSSTGSNANSYGYPITYKYEYSINGGTSWTNIASSTATSYSFTVPSNATTIMVRVTPSDSLGTGSAVTSNSYTVQKPYFIYAGKNGVNTITSARVGVGGGVRTVTSVAIAKDGVITKTI